MTNIPTVSEETLREKIREMEGNLNRLAYRDAIQVVAAGIFPPPAEAVPVASLVRAYGPVVLTQLNVV